MKIQILLISLLVSSCAGKMIEAVIPQKGYKAEEVGKIKSVAIISYDVLQFKARGISGKAASMVSTAQTGANSVAEDNILASESYDYLAEELKNQKGWKVLSLKEVVNNPVYREFLSTKKSQTQEVLKANHFHKPYTVPGLMRPINPEYMFTQEEISRLKKALNVDGLVMAELSYWTRQNDRLGLGIANIYLTSSLRFYLFDGQAPKPIWFNYAYEGPVSEESLGKVSGLEDTQKIEQLNWPIARQTMEGFVKSVQ